MCVEISVCVSDYIYANYLKLFKYSYNYIATCLCKNNSFTPKYYYAIECRILWFICGWNFAAGMMTGSTEYETRI